MKILSFPHWITLVQTSEVSEPSVSPFLDSHPVSWFCVSQSSSNLRGSDSLRSQSPWLLPQGPRWTSPSSRSSSRSSSLSWRSTCTTSQPWHPSPCPGSSRSSSASCPWRVPWMWSTASSTMASKPSSSWDWLCWRPLPRACAAARMTARPWWSSAGEAGSRRLDWAVTVGLPSTLPACGPLGPSHRRPCHPSHLPSLLSTKRQEGEGTVVFLWTGSGVLSLDGPPVTLNGRRAGGHRETWASGSQLGDVDVLGTETGVLQWRQSSLARGHVEPRARLVNDKFLFRILWKHSIYITGESKKWKC